MRQRDVQDILNGAHVDEAETMGLTPDAYDMSRMGVLVADSRLIVIRVKNTGGNQIKFQIEGSVDGEEFDEIIRSESLLREESSHNRSPNRLKRNELVIKTILALTFQCQ